MRLPIVFIFCLSILKFPSNAQVKIEDSLALVNLYNSTNGVNWKTNDNWLSGPVNEWFGISTTGDRVSAISLINNNLQGSIPSSFGDLTAITGIYLSNNQLTGNIPVSICDLPSLLYLFLNYNQLSGPIPANLGNITTLRAMYLDHNLLDGEIPSSFGQLTRITEMVLSYNKLTGTIPTSLGSTRVERLELNNNLLSGNIPDRLMRIRNLAILKLNNNQLTGTIPVGLASITCFTFDLSSNLFTGEIPSDLGNNNTLAHVNLSNNALAGEIPTSIGNMSGLQTLELDSNQLTGTIPATFKNLNRLVQLNLMNNQLSGSIPPGLCDLPDLEFFYADNNQFTFDGMECIGENDNTSIFKNYSYEHQKTLTLSYRNSELSLTAGGTLANNTYHIYKDSVFQTSVKGDSTFPVSEGGKYWVEVTNDMANELILYSNQIDVSSSVILPLQWLGVTAEKCADNICLQWHTEHEQNTSHFEVEKSTDGVTFVKLSSLPAKNKAGKQEYNAKDYSPAYGINYFRIKQVDLDGTYTYSDLASVSNNANGILSLAPNPANDYFALKGISTAKMVSLFAITGQKLKEWYNISGNQQLNISDLQQGVYLIKVMYNNNETVYKLIKQ